MSKKRRVLRVQTAYELDEGEQESLVDDVASLVSGDDVRGHFISCGGTALIEWEGDANLVDDRIDDVLADSRVSDDPADIEELQDVQIDSGDFDQWYGHSDQSDAYRTVN